MSRRARSFNQFENAQEPTASASFASSGSAMPSSSHSAFQNVKDEHARLFGEVKSLTSKFMDQIRVYKEHGEEVKRLMKAHEELLQDVRSTQASIPFDALLNEVKDVIQLHDQFVREGKGVSPEMLRQVQDIALRLQNTSIELQRELDDEQVALDSKRRGRGRTDIGSWLGSMWPFPSFRSIWNSFKSFLPWFLVLLLAFGTYNLFFADHASSSRYSRSVRQPSAPGVHTADSPAYLRHVEDRGIPQYDDRTIMERVSDSVSSSVVGGLKHKAQEKVEDLRETVHDAKETVKANLHAAADLASDVAGKIKNKAGEAIQDTKAKLEDWKEKASDVVDSAREKASELGHRASRTYEHAKDRAEDVLDSAKDRAGRTYERVKDRAEDVLDSAKDKAERAYDKTREVVSDASRIAKDKAEHVADQAGHAWEKAKDKVEDAWDSTKDKARQVADKAGDTWDATKDTARQAADKAGDAWDATKDKARQAADKAGDTWDATKDKARQAADKAGDTWDATKDKAERAWDKTKDGAEDAWEATKDKARHAADKAGDTWEATKDKARHAADRADQAWDATKEKARDVADRAGEKLEYAKDSAQDSFRRGEERVRETDQEYRRRAERDAERHRESHYKAEQRYSSIPADEVYTHHGRVEDRHPHRSIGDAVTDKMHDIGDKLSNAKDRMMDQVHRIKDRVSHALRPEVDSPDYPAGMSEADAAQKHPMHPAVDSMPYSPVPYLVTGFIGLAILLAVVTVLTAAAQARAEGEELAVRRKAHSVHRQQHAQARVLDDKLTVERDTIQMDKEGNVFETRRINQFDVAAA